MTDTATTVTDSDVDEEAVEAAGAELVPAPAVPVAHPGLLVGAEHLQLLRDTLNPDLTDGELALFAQVANRVGLDPFARQVYAVKRRQRGQSRMVIQTGIDGYRLIARRTGDYAGRLGPYFADSTGKWRMMTDGKPLPWLDSTPPAAAMVGVLRRGDAEPTWGIATWAEYAVTADGQDQMWRKMPSTMLAKCAEAQAIRACFPAETSGVYTDEEMAQADNPAPGRRPAPAGRGGGTRPPAGGTIDPWTARPSDVVAALRDRGLDVGGKVDDLRQRLYDAVTADVIDVDPDGDADPAPASIPDNPEFDVGPPDNPEFDVGPPDPADLAAGDRVVCLAGVDVCSLSPDDGDSGVFTVDGWYCTDHAPMT